jgi:hypothetical protein
MNIGYIYKIYDNTNNNVYYGSTIQKLSSRLSGHRRDYKKFLNGNGDFITSFKILEYGDYAISLVETVEFNDKIELKARERNYIENNECVNKNLPNRTSKEYREANKDNLKEKNKEYYETNKEVNKEQRKEYYEANKEQIKEKNKQYNEKNKEQRKEQTKNYYQANKEQRKEKVKEYQQQNKERIKEYQKQYREAKKQLIN